MIIQTYMVDIGWAYHIFFYNLRIWSIKTRVVCIHLIINNCTKYFDNSAVFLHVFDLGVRSQ